MKDAFLLNSRQGTAWGTASLSMRPGQVECRRRRCRCTFQGTGRFRLFLASHWLPLLPPPQVKYRCAAQRSWVSSCCCGSTRRALCFLPQDSWYCSCICVTAPDGTPFPLPLLPVDGGLLHHRASTRNRCVRGRAGHGASEAHLLGPGAAGAVGKGVVRGGWLSQSPGCRE